MEREWEKALVAFFLRVNETRRRLSFFALASPSEKATTTAPGGRKTSFFRSLSLARSISLSLSLDVALARGSEKDHRFCARSVVSRRERERERGVFFFFPKISTRRREQRARSTTLATATMKKTPVNLTSSISPLLLTSNRSFSLSFSFSGAHSTGDLSRSRAKRRKIS